MNWDYLLGAILGVTMTLNIQGWIELAKRRKKSKTGG